MRNRIHLVSNCQVGCYRCHFVLKLTIYSSGLPTSYRYLLPQDLPVHFVIIISSLPLQQIMAPRTPHQGESGTGSSRTMGTLSNMPCAETQLQRRNHVAHPNHANAATEHVCLDSWSKIVHKTGSSQNKKQHVIGCEYSRFEVDCTQLII